MTLVHTFQNLGWKTPAQISKSWTGISEGRVNFVAWTLGIRDSNSHCNEYETEKFLLSPEAIELVERELISLGYRRAE
jgi:hypothetical protein